VRDVDSANVWKCGSVEVWMCGCVKKKKLPVVVAVGRNGLKISKIEQNVSLDHTLNSLQT
jgi:hypothetical protein